MNIRLNDVVLASDGTVGFIGAIEKDYDRENAYKVCSGGAFAYYPDSCLTVLSMNTKLCLRSERDDRDELISGIVSILERTPSLSDDFDDEEAYLLDEALDEISGDIETFKTRLEQQGKQS